MPSLFKFPRTPHIEGSRLQAGDEDLEQVPFRALTEHQLVVSEKLDGANVGISFDVGGRLWLQSRGHFLSGGPRERHFALFKTWTACHQCRALGLDSELVERETDPSVQMEGLGEHWLDRPVIPNLLREGVDLYGEQP